MPLIPSELGEIPISQTRLTVYYRTVWIPTDDPPDPLLIQPNSGRWRTGWTLYTAQNEAVAWAEYCRNHPDDIAAADLTGGVGIDHQSLAVLGGEPIGEPLLARSLFRMAFSFTRLADLTSEWSRTCLNRAGFAASEFQADRSADYGLCPELAHHAVQLGWEAMIVPSAAWRTEPGFCVPVFEAGRACVESVEELARSARPTVALAIATTYENGLRPAWLG